MLTSSMPSCSFTCHKV